VDAAGARAVRPEKHSLAQAFGLFALSAYAETSGDAEAQGMAAELFDLLVAHARDDEQGGCFEFLEADWQKPPPERSMYIGVRADEKSTNTHLHLLEGLTQYYRFSPDNPVERFLRELIDIQSRRAVAVDGVAGTNMFRADWTPCDGESTQRILYGHIVENIWLLLEARGYLDGTLAVVPQPLLDCFEKTVEQGYDYRLGGFYAWGSVDGKATRFGKDWWVQAEALVCTLYLYRINRDPTLLNIFAHILAWIEKHQVDCKAGDWHRVVTPLGRRLGSKADSWKTPYHNGRAMLKCLQLIDEL